MARRPRLATLGTSPSVAQIRIAAERLKWRRATPAEADLVYVGPGHLGDLSEVARSGVAVALDVDLVAELGPDGVGALVAESAAGVRRAEPLASAPAVARWLREVRGTAGITHLSGLSRSPSLGTSMVAVCLYGARMAGWAVAPQVTSPGPGRLTLRFGTAEGDREAALDLVGSGGELPQWELQAASPERVMRVALLPEPRIEINGDETVVPAEHPAAAFGHEAFLAGWWRAVDDGVPARHDPVFVAALTEAAALVSA